MKIVLLRHGKPDFESKHRLKSRDISTWIERYDSAPLDNSCLPDSQTRLLADECNLVVCSNLVRSMQSAQLLGLDIHVQDPLFREAGLPHAALPWFAMKPDSWGLLFRSLWLMGYSKNGESLKDARLRALNGAQKLQQSALKFGSVLLVGHAIINRLIGNALNDLGWQGEPGNARNYWNCAVYNRN